jgi:hypothetical protein
MNKNKNKAELALQMFAVCTVLILACVCGSASAKVDYALMLQQTPVDGGSVSPDIGVHNISANGAVTVTATPKPGYQFVYWLGDVAEPTSNSTVISLDAPKIVVAVFQRSEYELPFAAAGAQASGGGGGGMVRNNNGAALPFETAPGGQKSSGYSYAKYKAPGPTIPATTPPFKPQNWGDDPAVNGKTPEPATVLLLGIGSLLVLKRKK